tara:strand:- start:343 stop:558 length:216 start_codon:yes stop_codon:yes gene_type:complete
MISAAMGMVVMSAATVAMLVAVNISSNEMKKSGRYYPTEKEKKEILERFNSSDIKKIENVIDQLDFGKISY